MSAEVTGPQRLRWRQNAKNAARANAFPKLPNSGHVVSASVIPNPVWQVQQHDVTVRSSEGSVNKKGSGYFAKSIDFKDIADDPPNMGTPPF